VIELIPSSWWLTDTYKFRVHVGYHRVSAAWDWCAGTFGAMHDCGWIDQGSYICFVDQCQAALFDMVWS
jgi:hypothetical protein